MVDINNIKIGNNNPSAIMFDKPTIINKEGLFDYKKWANDAGGYYVHGLWIAPTTAWGLYSWPWDLNVPNGALKDENNGFRYWGYVQDGISKNVTKGMKKDFPTNGIAGPYQVAISLQYNTPNYTDEDGKNYLDLSDCPVVITFCDDRFDDFNWIIDDGSIVDISEDKRTITIHRVQSNGVVMIGDNGDTSIEKCRAVLEDVIVDVTGLSYNYKSITLADPTSVECWDVKMGDKTIYHKDKTLSNCWDKHGLIKKTYTESVWNPETNQFEKVTKEYEGRNCELVDDAINIEGITDLIIPPITDLADYFDPIEGNVRFRVSPVNEKEFWTPVKEYLKNNLIDVGVLRTNLFKDSNCSGEVHFNLSTYVYDQESPSLFMEYLSDMLNGSKIEKAVFNSDFSKLEISIGNNMFKNAGNLKEIVWNVPYAINGTDISGMFEYCSSLKEIPNNLIVWGVACTYDNYPKLTMNVAYTFELCAMTKIPLYLDYDRFHANNILLLKDFTPQMLNNAINLTYFGPVIDARYLNANKKGYTFRTFKCPTLTDIRIRNLNHGDWHFDDTANSFGEIQGHLPNLDAESVKYLFDNLSDLTTYNPNVHTGDSGHHFNYWDYDAKIVTKLYSSASTAYRQASTASTPFIQIDKAFETMQFTVSGLIDGDRLEFGSGVIPLSTKSITTDGTYTISKNNTDLQGFILYNDSNPTATNVITIQIINAYQPANPFVDHAGLYCPNTWRDKVSTEMIQAANTKGWTIYFGGIETTQGELCMTFEDVTSEFTFEEYHCYGNVGGTINVYTDATNEHTIIIPSDNIHKVDIGLTSCTGQSMIQYCNDDGLVISRDALNLPTNSTNTIYINWPEGATKAYISGADGKVKLYRVITNN